VNAQSEFEPVKLLQPTGAHAVGTVTYNWADETRQFNYSSFPGDRRKIIVQVWFPAERDPEASMAPYSAVSADYQNVEANSKLSPAFSQAVSVAPLILISPGRGVERFGNTTIAEDVASHGYLVAAVDMPEIGYLIYPEGYIALPNPQFRPSRELMSGPYEKVDKFFEEPTEIGRQDLELALQNIRRLNQTDPTGRFVGKIDATKIGIFGHSLGGRIAGAFADQNENVKAYFF
jgi:predicted dienelactone hydrolase